MEKRINTRQSSNVNIVMILKSMFWFRYNHQYNYFHQVSIFFLSIKSYIMAILMFTTITNYI